MGVLVVLAIAAAALAPAALAAPKTWFGGTGNWNVTDNWVPAGVPGAADDVTISAGTATLDIGAAVNSLTVGGMGTLNLADGNDLSVAGNVALNSGGVIDIGYGSIVASATGTFTIASGGLLTSGVLMGADFPRIEMAVVNGGEIRPGGSSRAALGVVGNYTQTATGVLTLDIGAPADLIDQLLITADAVLAGTLKLTTTFSPTPGFTWDNVVLYDERSGIFTNVQQTGVTWQVSYVDDGIPNPPPDNVDGYVRLECCLSTAVSFRSFAATRTGRDVTLRWRTASHRDVLGFNVFREVRGKRVRVNTRLIATKTSGSYSFRDAAPAAIKSRYWIQVVHLDGSRTLHGPARVSARR